MSSQGDSSTLQWRDGVFYDCHRWLCLPAECAEQHGYCSHVPCPALLEDPIGYKVQQTVSIQHIINKISKNIIKHHKQNGNDVYVSHKIDLEDSVKDNLIITSVTVGLFYVLKMAKVKPRWHHYMEDVWTCWVDYNQCPLNNFAFSHK